MKITHTGMRAQKIKKKQEVALDHRLQPHDRRNDERAVLPDDLEHVQKPRYAAQKVPVCIDEEQNKDKNVDDRENFADHVEHFLHRLLPARVFAHNFSPPK